jgi:uncharacterized membrane protein
MTKGRLEAFSDGVLAIIITIMVLELKEPEGETLAALQPLLPKFSSYVLSFIYVGIYWNNHHHLLHSVKQIRGNVLWFNMLLLFWLSLVPFATAWVGSNLMKAVPVAIYGVVLLMAAISYTFLLRSLLKVEGKDSTLAKAIGKDWKGRISVLLYIAGILCSLLIHPVSGYICYVAVALIWFIPDTRLERNIR